eukprot:1156935-Pelagomonas_calceolata.AAC.2
MTYACRSAACIKEKASHWLPPDTPHRHKVLIPGPPPPPEAPIWEAPSVLIMQKPQSPVFLRTPGGGVIHNIHVSDLLHANYLCLMRHDHVITSNSPNNLQTMLHRLKAFTRRRFLTMNTKTSVVVCFNSRTKNLPPLVYDDEIPGDDVGDVNLHYAAEEALKRCLAGLARVRASAHQHQIVHRLHAYFRLFKTYVIPAGMYASRFQEYLLLDLTPTVRHEWLTSWSWLPIENSFS